MTWSILLTLLFSLSLEAQVVSTGVSEGQKYNVEQLLKGDDIIWGMDFLNEDELIFTEKEGQVKVFNLKTKKLKLITGFPEVSTKGQGGLLDVKKDPNSDWIFFTYSKRAGQSNMTHLARAKIIKDKFADFKVLLQTVVDSNRGVHFGSRIAFQDDYVFFGMGDRGDRNNGQNLGNHGATIMRLFKDGRVPKDNPFVKNKKALPEIWTYGHRNPQGLVFDKKREILWEMEHGPRGGDELNILTKGSNYGWPIQGYGKEYWGPLSVGQNKVKGTVQPIKYYVPSIAPSGLEVYSGKIFKKWEGNLFAGALKLKHLNRVVIDKRKAVKEERLLSDINIRVRSVREGPDGYLYISSDNGKILRIIPAFK